jgi:hypothetical protein
VQLTYGGPASAPALTELTVGATPTVVVSEPTSGTLKIDLGTGHTFDASSTGSATGLTYQNADSPTTSQFATVDISEANDISTLQPALAGDTLNLGPIYDAIGGLGSVTASAAVINVNGLSTAASDGNVILTAAGALTVATNANLYTGLGTISLSADVNANGTGDNDTTDALAIKSGAVVTSSNSSSNAITLRGAAINIDTSSHPAVVGRGSEISTTPTATLTGLGAPTGLAFDSSGNLFVSNYSSNTVSEFAPGSTTPTATLTGLYRPTTPVFDRSGNLFVANEGNDDNAYTVSEFAPGHTTPTATITGLNGTAGLAVDSEGNLFVSNGAGTTVSEFAPGHTTSMATLTGLNGPGALAFDRSGNLFVANSDIVSEFAPGSTMSTATLTGLNGPTALAFDQSGDLFVINRSANTVSEFAGKNSAGGAVIRTAQSSQTMSIGGNASGANINLTNAELGQIVTTAAGTITFGDSAQTGKITFQDARNHFVVSSIVKPHGVIRQSA